MLAYLNVQVKFSGSGLLLPSTSMAAHAIDELVEIELEENIEVVENVSTQIDKGATTYDDRRLPFVLPPPPQVPRNTYPQVGWSIDHSLPLHFFLACDIELFCLDMQYVGKDLNVDVEGLEEEMVNVDIV